MKSDFYFLQKELSYKLYGIFIKIGKEFGCHFKEEFYHKTCKEEFNLEKIKYQSKPIIKVVSKITGNDLGVFIPDFIVEDSIIVEIKVQRCLMENSIDQLVRYLQNSKYEIGYLVNFGTSYTQIVRRVYSNSRKK